MAHKKTRPEYAALIVSLSFSALILVIGMFTIEDLTGAKVLSRLLWPLTRLMFFICVGLVVGQVIEASGWTRMLAILAAPLFRFGNLGNRCAAAFTAAFFSGVAANAMLLDFYKDGKITRGQLFLTNFVNQAPAYFLHLPTTFFIVIPLTGWAGALYFLITFLAMVFRTLLFFIYGRLRPRARAVNENEEKAPPAAESKKRARGAWERIKARFPGRITGIAIYVAPIYVIVFLLTSMGLFELARKWLAGYVVTAFVPVESLSVVILSFAAEFTSGFAAAGALLEAGVLTTKQTVLALLVGNIVAFPIRAIRHQLPRYMGIFSPKMGSQLLLMGQAFRISSLIITGVVYHYFF
ncbi:MAG: nucleoside recognition protein [Desulfobacterales bacterium]|nr:nucleoside recognition protein [Desulfobacterales bacterium]